MIINDNSFKLLFFLAIQDKNASLLNLFDPLAILRSGADIYAPGFKPMTSSRNRTTTERRIRAGLPILRWLQTTLPLAKSQGLLKLSLPYIHLDSDVRREAISANGVSCERITPKDHQPGKVLLYLHGGGFVFGITPLHLKLAAWLAKKMTMQILMVDYRLAPAYPYPAALNDCITAYEWLLKQGVSCERIVIAGDSAGGNLTITTMMKLRDSGIPLPAAAACLSPATDLSEKGSGSKRNQDPLLPPRAVRFYSQSYIGSNDERNPLISPVFGDLSGLPPLLVHVGEDEILREDAIRIVERAKACGVEVRLKVYPRMWHVFQLYLSLPQAVDSLTEVAEFLTVHLGSEKAVSATRQVT